MSNLRGRAFFLVPDSRKEAKQCFFEVAMPEVIANRAARKTGNPQEASDRCLHTLV